MSSTLVADDEPAGLSSRDRDLHADLERLATWRADFGDGGHCPLHVQAARHGERPVVAVEPTSDGVSTEIDHAPAVAVELAEHGIENAIEDRRKLLGPASRA